MPGRMTRNSDGVIVLIHPCEICGKHAPWGFGNLWACAEHRAQVEAQWVAESMAKSAEGLR